MCVQSIFYTYMLEKDLSLLPCKTNLNLGGHWARNKLSKIERFIELN